MPGQACVCVCVHVCMCVHTCTHRFVLMVKSEGVITPFCLFTMKGHQLSLWYPQKWSRWKRMWFNLHISPKERNGRPEKLNALSRASQESLSVSSVPDPLLAQRQSSDFLDSGPCHSQCWHNSPELGSWDSAKEKGTLSSRAGVFTLETGWGFWPKRPVISWMHLSESSIPVIGLEAGTGHQKPQPLWKCTSESKKDASKLLPRAWRLSVLLPESLQQWLFSVSFCFALKKKNHIEVIFKLSLCSTLKITLSLFLKTRGAIFLTELPLPPNSMCYSALMFIRESLKVRRHEKCPVCFIFSLYFMLSSQGCYQEGT